MNIRILWVRDKANLGRYISKFAKLIVNLSYMTVNTDIEFQIHISSVDRVTALSVH